LGIAVGWLAERAWAGAAAYAAAGLVAGLIFGGTIVSLRVAASGALPAVAIVTQAFNEILFPVGCALVLFAAGAVAKRMKPEG
jgi:hypothetical protein